MSDRGRMIPQNQNTYKLDLDDSAINNMELFQKESKTSPSMGSEISIS